MTQKFRQAVLFSGPVTFSGPVLWSFLSAPVPEATPPGVFLAAYMGQIVPADQQEFAHADRVIGLHVGGGDVALQGVMSNPNWDFQPSSPVFLGSAGIPTTDVPASGFQQQLGVAITETQMTLSLHTAIILA